MEQELKIRVGKVESRIRLKDWQKKIIQNFENNGGYSLENLEYLLEEEDFLERFSKYIELIPDTVKNFYQAQGYLEAIKVISLMKNRRLPEATSTEAERLSQEISEEVEKTVRNTFIRFLENENCCIDR